MTVNPPLDETLDGCAFSTFGLTSPHMASSSTVDAAALVLLPLIVAEVDVNPFHGLKSASGRMSPFLSQHGASAIHSAEDCAAPLTTDEVL